MKFLTKVVRWQGYLIDLYKITHIEDPFLWTGFYAS